MSWVSALVILSVLTQSVVWHEWRILGSESQRSPWATPHLFLDSEGMVHQFKKKKQFLKKVFIFIYVLINWFCLCLWVCACECLCGGQKMTCSVLSFHHEGPGAKFRPPVSVAGVFTHWTILPARHGLYWSIWNKPGDGLAFLEHGYMPASL